MTTATYELEGNREIVLPDYMNMLQPAGEHESDSYGPIIACGIKPGTTRLVSLTNDGNLYELDVQKFFLSDDCGELVYPVAKGRMIEFVRKNMIAIVESQDVLIASQEIQLINLEIGMNHENKTFNAEKND